MPTKPETWMRATDSCAFATLPTGVGLIAIDTLPSLPLLDAGADLLNGSGFWRVAGHACAVTHRIRHRKRDVADWPAALAARRIGTARVPGLVVPA
jgi:hypothetical protein